jgi:hypothetical protein
MEEPSPYRPGTGYIVPDAAAFTGWLDRPRFCPILTVRIDLPWVQEKEDQHYTYADTLAWDEGKRYELFDGEAVLMAPPNRIHQEILMELAARLYAFSKGSACKVYPAPLGVRLFPGKTTATIPFLSPTSPWSGIPPGWTGRAAGERRIW